jgi:hypothetical protein
MHVNYQMSTQRSDKTVLQSMGLIQGVAGLYHALGVEGFLVAQVDRSV